MNGIFDKALLALMNKTDVEAADVDELTKITVQHPYFSAGQLLLARTLHQGNHSNAALQARTAALYVPDTTWLNYQLTNREAPAFTKATVGEVHTTTDQTLLANVQQEPVEPGEQLVVTTTEPHPAAHEDADRLVLTDGDDNVDAEALLHTDTRLPGEEAGTATATPAEVLETPANPTAPSPVAEETLQPTVLPTEEQAGMLAEEEEPIAEFDGSSTATGATGQVPVSNLNQEEVLIDPRFEDEDAADAMLPAPEPVVTPPAAEESHQTTITHTNAGEKAPAETNQQHTGPASQPAPVTGEKEDMIAPIPSIPTPTAPATQAAGSDALIPIDPYFTVDYFASQGIKLVLDNEPAADKLTKQMKSFTQWLKQMKRMGTDVVADDDPNGALEANVIKIADFSNIQREVVTEAMADVLEKQGKKEKAAQVYAKLSFLHPDKSAYFADKIKKLKGIK